VLLFFPLLSFGQSGLLLLAKEQGLGSSLLSPPLLSNANTELITGNAAAFGVDNLDGLSGITANASALISSVSDDNGYEGTYVLKVYANGQTTGYQYAILSGIGSGIPSGTSFDFAYVYKREGGTAAARFRINDGTSNVIEHNDLSSTSWSAPVTGTFVTAGASPVLTVTAWANRPFTSPDGTGVLYIVISIKVSE
jgi:hypothetical protein